VKASELKALERVYRMAHSWQTEGGVDHQYCEGIKQGIKMFIGATHLNLNTDEWEKEEN